MNYWRLTISRCRRGYTKNGGIHSLIGALNLAAGLPIDGKSWQEPASPAGVPRGLCRDACGLSREPGRYGFAAAFQRACQFGLHATCHAGGGAGGGRGGSGGKRCAESGGAPG